MELLSHSSLLKQLAKLIRGGADQLAKLEDATPHGKCACSPASSHSASACEAALQLGVHVVDRIIHVHDETAHHFHAENTRGGHEWRDMIQYECPIYL